MRPRPMRIRRTHEARHTYVSIAHRVKSLHIAILSNSALRGRLGAHIVRIWALVMRVTNQVRDDGYPLGR